jgi:hypothetical protein
LLVEIRIAIQGVDSHWFPVHVHTHVFKTNFFLAWQYKSIYTTLNKCFLNSYWRNS